MGTAASDQRENMMLANHPPIPAAHIFWDNSNIYVSAQQVACEREGYIDSRAVRIHFENLVTLARAGRTVGRAVCVGSDSPGLAAVWKKLRATGFEVELYERGEGSGSEQGIDQCLQAQILRTGLDNENPGVIVMLTGDGAGYDTGVGFHADLERMHKRGWAIEVISWSHSCNKRFMHWAADIGAFIPLEKFYESITFVQHGRVACPVNLKSRHCARLDH